MHSQSNASVKEKYSFKTKLCIEKAAHKLHKPKINFPKVLTWDYSS